MPNTCCQLCSRLHSGLLVHLPQVVVHRGRADEQLGGDFAIGATLSDESGDPCFLGSQYLRGLHAALPGPVTDCFEFGTSPNSKAVGSHLDEHVISSTQLSSSVLAAALASQPLSEEKMGPCQLSEYGGPL